MDWIDLAKDRDMWLALVNAVMNVKFPLNLGNFSTSLTCWLLLKAAAPYR